MAADRDGDTGNIVSGDRMYRLLAKLYPICRSITGDGLRESLRILGEVVPVRITEIPTGTRVFDWEIPREWNIRDASIRSADGRRIVDFQALNLHVVNYSVPVRQQMSLDALRPHLHFLPEHPDWVPYRTSYYSEAWGFCVSARQVAELENAAGEDDRFDVEIDSTLEQGSLSLGEAVIQGTSGEEVIFSAHSCHPSLCNDNLSAMVVGAFLARELQGRSLRYTYRFLFAPGTIGAIAWLARNEDHLERIRHGLILACLGDRGIFHYKRSRRGAAIDDVVEYVLAERGLTHGLLPFTPLGYDERQFCSPGIDLPVGRLTRTPHGQYAEYHTSADDLSLVSASSLKESLEVCLEVVDVLEKDRCYRNVNPRCEPQLGRRGLYGALGGQKDSNRRQEAMLWILNLSDGKTGVLDIAKRSKIPVQLVYETAEVLRDHRLLEPVS